MAVPSSNYRPRDWSPLAASDPVPGDPAAIRDEVMHMKQVAHTLRDQARDLKTIGEGEGLKGKYADKLREKSKDLESRLRQTAERYEHAHGYLTAWARELEDSQSQSVTILRQAQAEEDELRAKHKNAPHQSSYLQPVSRGGDGGESPQAYAPDPLQPQRQALQRLIEHRDTRASYYAKKINDACHDVIKDGWWARRENEIDAFVNNPIVKIVFDAASWVVSVVAIVALFVTPAGWILDAALALTILLLAKDALAAAAGDGSWVDVGLDVFGLLTMGTGKAAFRILGSIRSGAKVAAEGAAAERATTEVINNSRPVLERAYAIMSRQGASDAIKARAGGIVDRIAGRAADAGSEASRAEMLTPMAEATQREALSFGGDTEAAGTWKDISRMRSAYSDSQAVQKASVNAEAWKSVFNASWRTGMAVDAANHALGSSDAFPIKPDLPAYQNFKDQCTWQIGSGW